MLVMKFGGASVKNADGVKNVCNILRSQTEKLVVVVSAMDKTTNQLEILAGLAREGKEKETTDQLLHIKKFHQAIMDGLFSELSSRARTEVVGQVEGYFNEIHRICQGILLLGEFPPRTYDRIVSYGEMIATAIVAHYLRKEGIASQWLDVRNLIRTDASYTQANVIWSVTRDNIRNTVLPLLEQVPVVITQGFIASTMEGKITTLGREGSDFTAAIFAHCLEAEKMVVWKDVPGVLSADPRLDPNAVKHDTLSYEEAVEMTFYGATVIHPKTIRPLYTSRIPLMVKSFVDVALPGTAIGEKPSEGKVSSRIVKRNVALLRVSPRDFSFMDEQHLTRVSALLARSGLALQLIQSTAISLSLVVNHQPEALKALASSLIDDYHVEVTDGLELLTFMNFRPEHLREAVHAKLVQQVENKLFVLR